jgi:WD40 repeat protein
MRTAVALVFAFAPLVCAADLPKSVFDRIGGGGMVQPDRPFAFDFHPNGRHLASSGADGTVRVWDVTTRKLLHTLSVKDEGANECRYSADGKLLFAHFSDGTVRRYAADADYKLLGTTAAKHLDSLSCSADGSAVAGLDLSDTLKVIDVKTGLDRLEVADAHGACLAPDGASVAVVAADHKLTVLAVPGGKPLHTVQLPKGEARPMNEVAFSPDGKRVVIAPVGIAGTVRVYELGKAEPLAKFDGEEPVRFVGNDQVAAKHRGRVTLFDLKTKGGREVANRVEVFAVSPDGKQVATDNGNGVGSGRIRLWDVAKGTEATAGDGGLLGTARGTEGTAWLFSTERVSAWKPGQKPTEVVTLPCPITTFATTADRLFVASADGVRSIDAKKPTAVTLLPGSPKGLVTLSASADGGVLAGADAGQQLVLCDGDGKNVRSWKLPAVPLGVAVKPDGKAVAQVGRDGYVRVWDADVDPTKATEKWKAKLARSPHAAVCYTPDGKGVVVASMLKVVVFDAESGKAVATLDRSWDDGPFVSVAVSPDGSLIAAGTRGTNGVAVWDRVSGHVVKRLTGSTTPLWQLTFADARTVLASDGEGAALAWDISDRRGKAAPTADELKAAWESLGRGPDAFWQAGWVFADAADPWTAFTDGIKDARTIFDGIDGNAALLGDPSFVTREKATKALLAAGVAALPAVTAIAEDPSKAGGADELTRLKAAVRLAEQLGGPKAAGTLDELTKFGGELGKEAEAAKKRMRK